MSRFLFVTWDGGGNLTSTLGLARGLAERGHDVRLLGHTSIDQRCGNHGWTFRPFTRTADLDSTVAFANEDDEMSFLVEELMFSRTVADDTTAELQRQPADVLVADSMLLGAISAGQASAIPTVALFHTAFALFRGGPFVDAISPALQLLNEVRSDLGLATASSVGEVHDGCILSICTSVRELEPPIDIPSNVCFIGPVTEAPQLMADVDEHTSGHGPNPLVVVSLSTSGQGQLEPIQRIVDALATLPVQVLVTTGPSIHPADVKGSANTRLVRYAAHDQVFPDASLIITHAGLGTVTRALRHGVPMLCMPMGRDQFFNADQVEALGTGTTIDFRTAPNTIAETATALLTDVTVRTNSLHVAKLMTGYGGRAEGLTRLEELAGQ